MQFYLAQEKRIVCVRGGGVVLSEQPPFTLNAAFDARLNTHLDNKQKIGRRAAQLVQDGMTEIGVYEANFRLTAVTRAEQVVALIDSSKFGKVDLTPFLRIDNISTLFTDASLSPEQRAQLLAAPIKCIICREE